MDGGGGGGGNPPPCNDTTLTKIFVGGLAWETQRDKMRRYFEQFGEIIEAVVITDKNTGRSKGYGFVTFKDPESAMRACQNPSPIIDGRRANCNFACLGAHKTRPPSPRHGRFRTTGQGLVTPPQYRSSSSAFIHQPAAAAAGQFAFPYCSYGFAGYSHQDNMYPLNYYSNLYGAQQFSPYFSPSGSAGTLHSLYPLYGAQSSSQTHHFGGLQYTPQPILQYPFVTQQFSSQPPPLILSLPTSFASSSTSSSSTSVGATAVAAAVPTPSAAAAATTTTTTAPAATSTTMATAEPAATTTTMATTVAAAAITTETAAAAAITVATTKAVPVTASGQKQSA